MGRPLKKSRFGNTANGGDQLRFDAYIAGAAADSYVLSQRGPNKYTFMEAATDTYTAVCRLVNKASGSLAAGEASMVVTPYSGNIGYASKITQHSVTVFASTVKGGVVTTTMTNDGTSAYVANEVITLTGGAGTGAKIRVLTVDGPGNILTYSIEAAGINYVGTNALTQASTTATGVGAAFTVDTVAAAAATYKWVSSRAAGVTTITNASVAGEASLVKL